MKDIERILYLDVGYGVESARAVGILQFTGDNAERTIVCELEQVAPYEPGAFYKRELPCLLEVIRQIPEAAQPQWIVIDGYVYLSNEKQGLGAHLFQELNGTIPVIGVAKSFFVGTEEVTVQVHRGTSKNPLYVSAIGTELKTAAEFVRNMKGDNRIPDLLKRLDRLTKDPV